MAAALASTAVLDRAYGLALNGQARSSHWRPDGWPWAAAWSLFALSGLILLEAVKQTFAVKPKGRRMPVRVFAPGALQPAGVGKARRTQAEA